MMFILALLATVGVAGGLQAGAGARGDTACDLEERAWTAPAGARVTAAGELQARPLSLRRRLVVIALSLGFFAGIVIFAGRKLLRAGSPDTPAGPDHPPRDSP